MHKKRRVAFTGLSGVIGRTLKKKFISQVDVIDLYNKTKSPHASVKHIKLDLLHKELIYKVLKRVNPDIIVHLAAITHIDKCEEDKKNGKNGNVWRLNVEASEEIARYSRDFNKHIIFLSTECVFNGRKKSFKETDRKNPISWYGVTKSEGEDRIIKMGGEYAIIRSVVAYHKNDSKKTIYGQILGKLKLNKPFDVVADQFFTPTYTEDIIAAIESIIKDRHTGIFHVAPAKSITPYDFAKIVAKKNNFPISLIRRKKLSSFYDKKRAALRLKNASLSSVHSKRKLKINPKSPKNAII